jgi:hypothetical protein
MKKITVFLSAATLLALVFAVTAFKAVPPPGPSANGQGTLNLPYMNGIAQHFSFHANTDANGNVSGSFESKSPGQDIRVHGTITCMQILADGKTAVLTGTVTKVVGEGFPIAEGNPIYFKVQDNGEGANAADDRFSDYFVFGVCQNFAVALPPIVSGNIQVKP